MAVPVIIDKCRPGDEISQMSLVGAFDRCDGGFATYHDTLTMITVTYSTSIREERFRGHPEQ